MIRIRASGHWHTMVMGDILKIIAHPVKVFVVSHQTRLLTHHKFLFGCIILSVDTCSHEPRLVSVCASRDSSFERTCASPAPKLPGYLGNVSLHHALQRAVPWPISKASACLRRRYNVQRNLVLHTRSWRGSKDSRSFEVGRTLREVGGTAM